MNKVIAIPILLFTFVSASLLLLGFESQTKNTFAQGNMTNAFTDSNFSTLYSSPNSYVGSKVNVTGKIYSIPPTGTTDLKAIQMHQGGNRDTNVLASYKDNGIQFSDDNCVRVTGTNDKQTEYRNLFGVTLTAATIRANSVEKIDCALAINPPSNVVTIEETQEDGGIKVILHKVEFSDKNTRAYLTVENTNPDQDITFYDFNSKAIQGKKQFGTTYSFDVDYPKIESNIPPGIQEDGVVLFKPLNSSAAFNSKFTFDLINNEAFFIECLAEIANNPGTDRCPNTHAKSNQLLDEEMNKSKNERTVIPLR